MFIYCNTVIVRGRSEEQRSITWIIAGRISNLASSTVGYEFGFFLDSDLDLAPSDAWPLQGGSTALV